jgi:hypothetical protein
MEEDKAARQRFMGYLPTGLGFPLIKADEFGSLNASSVPAPKVLVRIPGMPLTYITLESQLTSDGPRQYEDAELPGAGNAENDNQTGLYQRTTALGPMLTDFKVLLKSAIPPRPVQMNVAHRALQAMWHSLSVEDNLELLHVVDSALQVNSKHLDELATFAATSMWMLAAFCQLKPFQTDLSEDKGPVPYIIFTVMSAVDELMRNAGGTFLESFATETLRKKTRAGYGLTDQQMRNLAKAIDTKIRNKGIRQFACTHVIKTGKDSEGDLFLIPHWVWKEANEPSDFDLVLGSLAQFENFLAGGYRSDGQKSNNPPPALGDAKKQFTRLQFTEDPNYSGWSY